MSSESDSNQKLRLLLIGPLPPPIGGIRVSFQQLANDLAKNHAVRLDVVEIPFAANRLRQAIDMLFLIIQVAAAVPKADVVTLHATNQVTYTLGPYVWLLCKLFGKKSMLRKFGGNFDQAFAHMHPLQKWLLLHTTLRMDLVLLQTKHLVDHFSSIIPDRVAWFPTSRPWAPERYAATKVTEPKSAQRFAFVGHVKRTKGIMTIIEAATALAQHYDPPIAVDVYGPLNGEITEGAFRNTAVTYRGVLRPEDVISTLQSYDALLLPTFHPGEGYPGVILEGYSAGIPVIASDWSAIPEIVDADSGILVQPGVSESLLAAMQTLAEQPETYMRLRRGAQRKAAEFSSEKWSDKFVEYARYVLERS